jgi:hypothetical protein
VVARNHHSAVESHPVDETQAAGSQAVGSRAAGSQAVGSRAVESQAVGSRVAEHRVVESQVEMDTALVGVDTQGTQVVVVEDRVHIRVDPHNKIGSVLNRSPMKKSTNNLLILNLKIDHTQRCGCVCHIELVHFK